MISAVAKGDVKQQETTELQLHFLTFIRSTFKT